MYGAVTKAIIPAAGFGTRFLPVAKAVPKELLPILGRPVIDYVVAEAIEAGCTEIIIVISQDKEAIRRYFSDQPDLDARLEANGRSDLLSGVRELARRAKITFCYQTEPLGLGHAVMQGREFAGDDPFLVLNGDAITRPGVSAGAAANSSRYKLNLRATSANSIRPAGPSIHFPLIHVPEPREAFRNSRES